MTRGAHTCAPLPRGRRCDRGWRAGAGRAQLRKGGRAIPALILCQQGATSPAHPAHPDKLPSCAALRAALRATLADRRAREAGRRCSRSMAACGTAPWVGTLARSSRTRRSTTSTFIGVKLRSSSSRQADTSSHARTPLALGRWLRLLTAARHTLRGQAPPVCSFVVKSLKRDTGGKVNNNNSHRPNLGGAEGGRVSRGHLRGHPAGKGRQKGR